MTEKDYMYKGYFEGKPKILVWFYLLTSTLFGVLFMLVCAGLAVWLFIDVLFSGWLGVGR